MKWHTEKYLPLLPTALFCIGCILIASQLPVHDFANYYFGGKIFGRGGFTSQIYFPDWFNEQIVLAGHPPVFAGFAPNTPFLALLFYPLSFLPIGASKMIFNCLSVFLFLFSLGRIATFYKIGIGYLFLIPIFFLIPIRNDIFFGQVYLLLFFLLSESWISYQKQQPIKTAVFLSLAILLKVFPALLLLFFIFKKDFKTVAITCAGCVLLAALTLPFCSIETWLFYFSDVLSKASNGEIASAYVPNYQSVFMLMKQLVLYDAVENPTGLFANPALLAAIVLAFKLTVVAIGWYVTRKVQSQLLAYSYWILAAILISPYGSTYTFVLMLFLFLAIGESEMPQQKKNALLLLVFLISNLPIGMFINWFFPLSYLRCLLLIVFFIVILSAVSREVNWKMVGAMAVIALVFGFLLGSGRKSAGSYFLPRERPLLITDYEISNQKLTYHFRDQNGNHSQSVALAFRSISPADLIRNQIYYRGKLLVFDTNHKRKPILIDGKTLLYLTDANRGPGFYTLRKIDVR